MKATVEMSPHQVSICGPLVVETVNALFKATTLPATDELTISLQQVSEVDSGGLSLLLYWHNTKPSKQDLQFVDLPDSLLRLIRICQLDAVFGLSPKEA